MSLFNFKCNWCGEPLDDDPIDYAFGFRYCSPKCEAEAEASEYEKEQRDKDD